MLISLWNMVLPEFFLSEISSFVCCFSNNGTSSPRAWRSYQHCRWQRLPPRSGGETSHQHHRCDPKQQQYLFAVQKWNYLQIQNFLASFNFELHHLHVTRTWTTTYDFINIFSWLVTTRTIFLSSSIQEIIIFYDFHLWGRSHRQGIWLRIEILHTWPT